MQSRDSHVMTLLQGLWGSPSSQRSSNSSGSSWARSPCLCLRRMACRKGLPEGFPSRPACLPALTSVGWFQNRTLTTLTSGGLPSVFFKLVTPCLASPFLFAPLFSRVYCCALIQGSGMDPRAQVCQLHCWVLCRPSLPSFSLLIRLINPLFVGVSSGSGACRGLSPLSWLAEGFSLLAGFSLIGGSSHLAS
jgi:hypothetical protein